MHDLTSLQSDEQRAALAAGVAAIERIDTMIHQLEYLKAVQLASLTRLASRIAHDEQHADHGELVHRAVEAEVSVATRVGQVETAHRMGHADRLLADYPAVAEALSDGRLSLRHTEMIVEAGQIITEPESRSTYEAVVLPLAVSSTARQLRAHARRAAEHFAGRSLDERHREARERRCVRVVDLDDGMAQLTAVLGAVEAYAIKDRLSRIAYQVRRDARSASGDGAAACSAPDGNASDGNASDGNTPGDVVLSGCTSSDGVSTGSGEADPRTSAQIQADALAELLLTGACSLAGAHRGGAEGRGSVVPHPADPLPVGPFPVDAAPTGSGDALGAITGRVQISVPVLTLAGAPRSPETAPHLGHAELAGYGPIDTLTARRLAGRASGWERVLTHPVTGAVLAVDRYRPGEDLKRLLRARDLHCRFPGCTRRLDHCDIDHTVDAARGGSTEPSNLAHLCRRHHTLKHFEFLAGSAWRPRQRDGGVLEWRSPTGRSYVDTPTSTVRFAPVATRTPTRTTGTAKAKARTRTRTRTIAEAPAETATETPAEEAA